MERQYSMFHGTSNCDNKKTAQWNSSGPSFHLKIDAVFNSCIISSFILQYMFFWEVGCRSLHLQIFTNCNCLSQWTYTGRICLITLYFQRQEITTIGKYRLTLNINSVGNYYVGLFLVYACE